MNDLNAVLPTKILIPTAKYFLLRPFLKLGVVLYRLYNYDLRVGSIVVMVVNFAAVVLSIYISLHYPTYLTTLFSSLVFTSHASSPLLHFFSPLFCVSLCWACLWVEL